MSDAESNLKIELKDEQVKAVVAGAIMNLFTDEQREALMKGAIVHLMTPQRQGTYGPERTPLERIFYDACDGAARKWFYDRLTGEEDTPEKKVLRETMTEVFMRVMGGDERAVVIDALTDGFAEAFSKLKVRDY